MGFNSGFKGLNKGPQIQELIRWRQLVRFLVQPL